MAAGGGSLGRMSVKLFNRNLVGLGLRDGAIRAKKNHSSNMLNSKKFSNWFGSQSGRRTQSAVLSRGQEVYELQGGVACESCCDS